MDWLFEARSWRKFFQHLSHFTGLEASLISRALQTLLVMAVYLTLRKLMRRLLLRKISDATRRYKIGKTITYSTGIVALFLIAKIWLLDSFDLTTYLGFLSAGLAVALKDPITDMAGWLFLMWRQPFKVGDRIQLGEQIGDVIDMRMFMFSMLEVGNWIKADQSTGRIIHIPNSLVFTTSCANYTQSFAFIWNEIAVTVTFESDWEKARDILDVIATNEGKRVQRAAESQMRRVAAEYEIAYQHLTPIVWVDVVDFGVQLTMRYLCGARHRRVSSDRIWKQILHDFAQESTIDYAYPTHRFYDNRMEGKSGAGGPPSSVDSVGN